MTIRDREAFFASLPDWNMLVGCFGATAIAPTDIDGCVERRGHILLIEHKLPAVEVPHAQKLTFHAMTRHGITVVLVWGIGRRIDKAAVLSPGWDGYRWEEVDTDLDGLRAVVRSWFDAVEALTKMPWDGLSTVLATHDTHLQMAPVFVRCGFCGSTAHGTAACLAI